MDTDIEAKNKRTVLVPLDGSPLGEEALTRGLLQYRQDEVELVLCHCQDFNLVYASHPMMLTPDAFLSVSESEREHNEQYLEEQAEALRLRGYQARWVLSWGRPVDGILAAAEREKVDSILLTTHGRTGLSRLFMGSVAEGVVRLSQHPVTVVPSSVKLASISTTEQQE